MCRTLNSAKDIFIDKFKRARNAGTPIFAISCFDPAATMSNLQKKVVNGSSDQCPIIQWDIIDGWRHRNSAGQAAIEEALSLVGATRDETINPTESLKLALNLPKDKRAVLFMLNVHHYLDRDDFLQALWNVRDHFKSNQIALVLLGTEFTFPSQIQNDILLLDEPLPSDDELKGIINDVIEGSGATVAEERKSNAITAIRGLSAFPAESSVAMNLKKDDLDIDGLWDVKKHIISTTPGLRVYSGKELYSDIGGCEQIKRFMHGVITGKEAPNVIVFLDEGEKLFAGATGSVGDSSGVAQDQLASMLSYMEDNESDGAIFYGPPGAAKSAIAKATGNEAGVPTVLFDLGGMKGSLVGKSEAQMRNALKVITAVGGNKAFFIMTCNQIISLPPELRRRFTSGIFFFDLPTKDERETIWSIYLKKWSLSIDEIKDVDDRGWTGAEIRNCCRMAYRQNISLAEAAKYIVPISKSSPAQIEQLRQQASGAYLSANADGIYRYETENVEDRKIRRAVSI